MNLIQAMTMFLSSVTVLINYHGKGSDFPLSEPGVKGRLAQKLEAPPFVIDIVKQGYSSPFRVFPPRFLFNNRPALRNPQFVQSAIVELLERRLIQEHSSPPHCVNPLTVAEGKKLRLVIDLREVNKYLVKPN